MDTMITRFPLWQKIIAWTGFFVPPVIGLYCIFRVSFFWAVVYGFLAALAFMGGVLPRLCAHCPYPYKHKDCLGLPAGLVPRLFKYKGASMTQSDKVVLLIALAALFLFPQYWLLRNTPLLIAYWAAAVPMLLMIPLHICPRCRHTGCPLNRAGGNCQPRAGSPPNHG